METEAAIGLLLSLLDRAAQWGAVVQKARSEGRTISDAEVNSFVALADESDLKLQAAIKAAKAEGR